MTKSYPASQVLVIGMVLLLTGCASGLPDESPYLALESAGETPVEQSLLDIGISRFEFSPIDIEAESQDLLTVMSDIRVAESRFMPVVLQHTLAETGQWGEIHVLPDAGHSYDVSVEGRIVESSGHTLVLDITVRDATGKRWFTKRYTEHVGDNVFSDDSLGVNDPLQGIYNRIANDMQSWLDGELDAVSRKRIKAMSTLNFGMRFAPGLYGQYVTGDNQDGAGLVRMPPLDDPVQRKLIDIRMRDRLFHGLLQEHYFGYARKISEDYYEFRRFSYRELKETQQQHSSTARWELLWGAMTMGLGVATLDLGNVLGGASRAGGALLGENGLFNPPDEATLLREISESFASDVISEVISLDEDVIILSGRVDEIYQQWEALLQQVFDQDRGVNLELRDIEPDE